MAYINYQRADGSIRRLELGETPIIIGRSKSADLQILDAKASRHHCSITFIGGVFKIKDLGSSNGTQVNGKRISESELKMGDRITIGDTSFRFEYQSDSPVAPSLHVNQNSPHHKVEHPSAPVPQVKGPPLRTAAKSPDASTPGKQPPKLALKPKE